MIVRRPKCLRYNPPPSYRSTEWKKSNEISENLTVGYKTYRRHILTNQEAKCSIYWLSPETSPTNHTLEAENGYCQSKIHETTSVVEDKKTHENIKGQLANLCNTLGDLTKTLNQLCENQNEIDRTYDQFPSQQGCDRTEHAEVTAVRVTSNREIQHTLESSQHKSSVSQNRFLKESNATSTLTKQMNITDQIHLPQDPYFLDEREQEKILRQQTSSRCSSSKSFSECYENLSDTEDSLSESPKMELWSPFLPPEIQRHRAYYNKTISPRASGKHCLRMKSTNAKGVVAPLGWRSHDVLRTKTRLDHFTNARNVNPMTCDSSEAGVWNNFSFITMKSEHTGESPWILCHRETALPAVQALHLQHTRMV